MNDERRTALVYINDSEDGLNVKLLVYGMDGKLLNEHSYDKIRQILIKNNVIISTGVTEKKDVLILNELVESKLIGNKLIIN